MGERRLGGRQRRRRGKMQSVFGVRWESRGLWTVDCGLWRLDCPGRVEWRKQMDGALATARGDPQPCCSLVLLYVHCM